MEDGNNRQEAEARAGCRLDRLATAFTPERITLTVELVPPEGCRFDAPMTEPGKRLGMVANYARTVFDVALMQQGRQKRQSRQDRPTGKA
jgi:hypothetical protein